MSDILFGTTPKFDLPYQYYILRNSDPLRTELKDMNFSMLGTILYLDIQKVKDSMKTLELQQDIVGTVSCMKRLTRVTNWCDQLL